MRFPWPILLWIMFFSGVALVLQMLGYAYGFHGN